MIAESAAQVVSLLSPLLVVVLVAAVIASAAAETRGRGARDAEAEADARAREWARYVFGAEADVHAAAPCRRLEAVARQEGCG
ncbi:hypothetical protein GUJ93_ZPchr0013g36977 [Zizania palustris]|uniref:Uncharacterized protein n=1 Tax=Zizania palustris TaxID=103762 RepID=A0A8J5WYJ6_ZIZPA|nr:hypothetical protein GUJ93_ZPchr0013g36977 [Zizania palustris]